MSKACEGKTQMGRKYLQNACTNDKRLLFKICNELLKLKVKKINNPVYKCVKDLNIYLTKEDIQMEKKYVKRCSISYIIRELQIKMRYYFTPIRMAKI